MTKWDTPKLVVLAKGTPEERVLVVCKGHTTAGPGKTTCWEDPSGNPGGGGQNGCSGVTGS